MRRELVGDQAIAELAGRQGGAIARGQLLGLGLSGAGVDRRIRLGRLHPVHRGVYTVGHRVLGVAGHRWAAVLACAPGAVLSHTSAAAAWDLRASGAGVLHVTVGPGGRARRPGLRIHRTDGVRAVEVTLLDGLPITTPARTLLDLAAWRAPTRGGARPRRAAPPRGLRRARAHGGPPRRSPGRA